jgi:hypothetical protein
MNRIIKGFSFVLILTAHSITAQENNLYGRWVCFDNDQNELIEFEFTNDKLIFMEDGQILFESNYTYTDSFIVYSSGATMHIYSYLMLGDKMIWWGDRRSILFTKVEEYSVDDLKNHIIGKWKYISYDRSIRELTFTEDGYVTPNIPHAYFGGRMKYQISERFISVFDTEEDKRDFQYIITGNKIIFVFTYRNIYLYEKDYK